MLKNALIVGLILSLLAPGAGAQPPVLVGKGSYADSPPPSAGKAAAEMVQRTFPLVDGADRPIPTNKHWTALLSGKPSGSLWLYPFRVDPKETGIELFLPLRWNENGSDPVSEAPLRVSGVDFKARALLVKDWGDWTLTFRLEESKDRYLDITVGEGMPLVWVESHGVPLEVRGERDATFRASPASATGESILATSARRSYGIYVPRETKQSNGNGAIRLTLPAGRSVAAFAALGGPADLARFAAGAFAIPRDSRVDWSYDPKAGKVATTWTVRTEALAPGQKDVVAQGWLAHHWRGASHTLNLDGPEFLTPRGPLKTTVGNRFQLTYDFDGFLPYLPAPAKLGLPNDFDPTRLSELLALRARNPKYGDDSYWGGKDLLQFAQYLLLARELGDPTRDRFRDEARKALADWLTYTPGENAHYFTRYKNWHALIGIKDSYDSARFNDQHFHYGYFTMSTALLAMDDPGFLDDYGEMIRLVAKQYANWDRKDMRFPLFRTLDLWAGHSWAGGLGSAGGNNQESSSEAMQSWIGLYLLGTMLGDTDMTAAGALGYALESKATMEYWFNVHGGIFPTQYKHPVVGVLWSGGLAYGTYFSGDPAWIYAIQCLPQSPGLDYLVRDLEPARRLFHTMLSLRKQKEGTDDLARMGDLGNVMLAQASLADPEWAVREFDRLWDAKNGIARDNLDAARVYSQAHAYRKLGRRLWDHHLSLPTSAVYQNDRTKTTSYVAYNPHPYPVVVDVRRGTESLGRFVAEGHRLTTATNLQRNGAAAGLAGSLPADGAKAVPRRTDRLFLVFNEPLDPASLTGITLDGPGQLTLKSETEDGGKVVVSKLGAPLQPSATYRLRVPSSLKKKAGGSALATERTITFTVEPQPPLALEKSVPTDGQDRVDTARPELLLSFNAPIDARSIGRIRLVGPNAPAVKPRLEASGWQVGLEIASPLEPDASYVIVVPSDLASAFGQSLASEQVIHFSTTPPPCPPNIFGESYAGGGYGSDSTLKIDLHNAESPHSGRYAIKLQAPAKEGTIYLFRGTSDNGDGRRPANLSSYRRVEFWMKGTTDRVWVKVGHPVFDKKAFTQTQLEGVTRDYKRFSLELPEPKTEINTLLVVSVPAGATLFLDDIRFVGNDSNRRGNTTPGGVRGPARTPRVSPKQKGNK